MASYFSDIVKDLKNRTEIATNALMESEETAEVSFNWTIAQIFKICISTFVKGRVPKHSALFREFSVPFR